MLARRTALRASTSGAVAEEEVTAARSQVERRRDAIAVAEAGAREAAASRREAEAARVASAAEEAEAVAGVAQARAKLALVTKTAADTGVRSPIHGTVRRRHVTLGQYVKAGDPIAEIVDRSRLLVRFRVSEAESARLARDMKVVVRVPALDALEHPAVLVHVDETASATTRMVECLAELGKPASTLKPGFYAVASVVTKTSRAPRGARVGPPADRAGLDRLRRRGREGEVETAHARPAHAGRPRRGALGARRRRHAGHEGRQRAVRGRGGCPRRRSRRRAGRSAGKAPGAPPSPPPPPTSPAPSPPPPGTPTAPGSGAK